MTNKSKPKKPTGPTPISEMGADHWSTFAYLISSAFDGPDPRRMRTDGIRHPMQATRLESRTGCSPTRLKECKVLPHHDDWDCAEDLEAAGLLLARGTGLRPLYTLTEKGYWVMRELLDHKHGGGHFATFTPKPESA